MRQDRQPSLYRAVFACMLFVPVARAQTILYVDQDAVGPTHDGGAWCTAYTELHQALAAATANTVVRVANGTYTPDPTGLSDPRTAAFPMIDGVIVEGGYAGCNATDPDQRDTAVFETILSGDLSGNDGNVLVLDQFAKCYTGGSSVIVPACQDFDFDFSSSIDGLDFLTLLLTINFDENSYHVITSSGNASSATVDGCTITGGSATGAGADQQNGGGMYAVIGAPRITSCAFRYNVALAGGGVYNDINANTLFVDCTFTSNFAYAGFSGGFGGGAVTFNSQPSFQRCGFWNNGSAGGGGMFGQNSTAVVEAGVFMGNRALTGAGIYSFSSNTLLLDSLFSGNIATIEGGGIRALEGSLSLVNTSLSGNDAMAGGGVSGSGAALVIENTILWGNTDDGGSGEAAQLDVTAGSALISNTCIQALNQFSGNNNIGDDPMFRDPPGADGLTGTSDDDLRLQSGSPAVDVGDNNAVSTLVDLDGNDRIMDGDDDGTSTVDMGAYEFEFVPPPVCFGVRDLSLPFPGYESGVAKTVRIALLPGAETTVLGIEDAPPPGWIDITNVSNGGSYDAIAHKVKWGPLFAPFPAELTYDITPPATADQEVCFDGITSENGERVEVTCGDLCIELSPCPFLPADDPQPSCPGCADCTCDMCHDGRVVLCEMIGYACAWKSGCNDNISAMTRAAFLWQVGEFNCWDSDTPNWISLLVPPVEPGCCDPDEIPECYDDIDCDDGDICTNDSCDVGTCEYTDNSSPCDDGDLCTAGDACAAGACSGVPINCGLQLCDPADGICKDCLVDGDCDDLVACTDDSCDAVLGCQNADNCTGGDVCSATTGLCEAPPPIAPPLPIVAGDAWRYFKGTQAPPVDWNEIAFDDSSWLEGPTGIGYETDTGYESCIQTDLTDMPNGYLSVFARRSFHLDDPSALIDLVLAVDFDDGYIAYVNGVEVASLFPPSPPDFDQPASTPNHEACCGTGVPTGPCPPAGIDVLSSISSALVIGTNVLAVQVHNRTIDSSDFIFVPELTTTIPDCFDETDCDDGDICTDDSCVAGTCAYTDNSASCDDGALCTTGDACAAGICVGIPIDCGVQVCDPADGACKDCQVDGDCDDLVACTVDSCDAVLGCRHVDSCPAGELCDPIAGTCIVPAFRARIELVALDLPSASDTAVALPGSLTEFLPGETLYLEVWAQTPVAEGLQSVSADIQFDASVVNGVAITHSSLFDDEFTNGSIDNVAGLIDDLSGSHALTVPSCTDQVGLTPGWARVATIEMIAGSIGTSMLVTGETGDEIWCTTICGASGNEDPSDIVYGQLSIHVVECFDSSDCDDLVACTDDSCNAVLECRHVDNCAGSDVCDLATGVCGQPLLPIVAGDTWRYFKGSQAPPNNWTEITFDDSMWLLGATGLGYETGTGYEPCIQTNLTDMPNGYFSVFARREFSLADPGALVDLVLSVDFDDGYIAYVNGVEVDSQFPPSPADFDQPATTPNHEACCGTDTPTGPCPPAGVDILGTISGALVAGTNVVAIQGHNRTIDSSDFILVPELTATLSAGVTEQTGGTASESVFSRGIDDSYAVMRIQGGRYQGGARTVHGTISIHAAEGTVAIGLEVNVPQGWNVTAISDNGAWDSINRKVKWGPLFGHLSPTLWFDAGRSNGKGSIDEFSGTVSFDGYDEPVMVLSGRSRD